MKTYLLRGVPASLQMDGWWLSAVSGEDAPPVDTGREDGRMASQPPLHMLLLLGLILLADWLFWGYGAGLSLVLFAVAICLAVFALTRPRFGLLSGGVGVAIVVIGLTPLLIYVQFLSVMIAIATLLGFTAFCACQGQGKTGKIIGAALRFLLLVPPQMGRDMLAGPRMLRRSQGWQGMRQNLALNWLLPAVVGMVFLWLLVLGNPMFAHIFSQRPSLDANLTRLLFWAMILVFVWPFLTIGGLRERILLPNASSSKPARGTSRFLNAVSVRNSLVLFNLMFACQSALDMVYLWGGAVLPEGMTLASYAHRGAYPLVATALLAGLFALLSRPFVQARPVLKALLLLWLVQNLALVAASVLRLQLYVGSFGLTYLRVAAFIWLGMVAAGLVLIGWQLLRARGNVWLLLRISTLLVVVLYLCSLINFANLIAAKNLARAETVEAFSDMDRIYLCQLGPMALPAIARYEQAFGREVCRAYLMPIAPQIDDWREWGFRKWRVRGYLDENKQMEMLDEPENTDH